METAVDLILELLLKLCGNLNSSSLLTASRPACHQCSIPYQPASFNPVSCLLAHHQCFINRPAAHTVTAFFQPRDHSSGHAALRGGLTGGTPNGKKPWC